MRTSRAPRLLDAVTPVVVLILLIGLTIVIFGPEAADGPLQIALMVSAVFAGLAAFKNGYTDASVRDAVIGGVTSALGAIYILLAVGALIGAWNMSGTIPTVVTYGLRLLNPAIFYVAVAIICALVGAVTGSSRTTAGTLGWRLSGWRPSCTFPRSPRPHLPEPDWHPRMPSRTVQDSGTVTSPLVPWNSCGA